ncbi:SPFH domain / Band 7 family protein [Planctomycetes bacterium CA13]|uniref:SPFH domain / Band 7 family protein n=1 Tax=Novipirellula herctigrandis TaxID=2527986 RepID=A0A5C5ZA44_9BACT|nr:SPFH domain / Band 7 family protein [Planctomycetes bacterium CA13]
MSGDFNRRVPEDREKLRRMLQAGGIGAAIIFGIASLCLLAIWGFLYCRIEVPSRHIAVLTKKTGAELTNNIEIVSTADFEKFKGIQEKVLTEGRYFYNPWKWDWDIVPQVEVPENRLGVRIRLYGDDLGYGNLIAASESEKGISAEVLRPGRYPINALTYQAGTKPSITRDNYIELVELHEPVVIPAGFIGVVTLLSSQPADDPNQLIIEDGRRGVQKETLDPGVYYINPYVERISLVDCRSQRFNLGTGGEMGFPSRDGFWVKLDGRIEFRVDPERAAEVFVTYNDSSNDSGSDARVEEEIIQKIILPNARSFCRLRGSDHSGRDFILGEKRLKFQEDFQRTLEATCKTQGIEIVQALITRISPPQQIAEPVRMRQIALQLGEQYQKEIEQQESEKELRIEQELVKQKQALIEVEQEVITITIEAKRQQEVAVIEANQRKKVAEVELAAAEDEAKAITAKGTADAEVIRFGNKAVAAGWQKSVEAYGGSGDEFARWVMLKKLAPSFQEMMVNTSDSPLMNIFTEFSDTSNMIAKAADVDPKTTDSISPTEAGEQE